MSDDNHTSQAYHPKHAVCVTCGEEWAQDESPHGASVRHARNRDHKVVVSYDWQKTYDYTDPDD